MAAIAAAAAAARDLYAPAGLRLTSTIEAEAESADYGACRFTLDDRAVVFRTAKITPTKTGQFVTVWKRPAPGADIAPLDEDDDVQFVVIEVADGACRGQFVFSREVLLRHGVMSRNGKGGKRAIRVYPPWSAPAARQAVQTQHWQLRSFVEMTADGRAAAPERLQALLREQAG